MKLKEKTIAVLVFAVIAMSFMGAFVGAEFALPPIKLVERNSATVVWTNSIHLKTTGDLPSSGNSWAVAEATIMIMMPSDFTLGELETLSWYTYLVAGSTAHVDVILDLDSDGDYDDDDDALVIQYAYNDVSTHYTANLGDPSYGAETGAWYQTFSDDGGGPAVIDGSAMAWATKGAAGSPTSTSPNFFFHSLADWKEGITYTASSQAQKTIDDESIILRLEIEVDNWGDNSEAFVDDIEINGFNVMSVVGPQGPKGDTGATGPKGDRGSRGLTGSQGSIGPQGETGEAGLAGEDGSDGLQGPKGDAGLSGSQGIAGETGLPGSTGDAGIQGVAGEAGSQGPKGEQGDTGAVGPKGAEGEPAPASVAYGGAALGGVSLIGLLYMFFRAKP